MKLIISRILILTLVLYSLPLTSQTYYFDSYGVTEGLYQSRVNDIVQDNEHNIWLGTMGGVSVFNGKEFTNYTSENGLAQNGVQVVFKDSRGIIWLGHLGGGITRIRNKKIETFFQAGTPIKNDIMDIDEDSKHRIWIASHGSGAFCISNPTVQPRNVQYEIFKGNQLSDRVFHISQGNDSSLYFITDIGGIKKHIPDSNKFVNYEPKGLTNYFAKTCMLNDKEGNMWFGTYHGGLYKLDYKTQEFKIYDIRDGIASNWITSIKQDRQGNIWFGSWGNGITRISSTGEIKVFNNDNGLMDLKIACIFEDAEGNMLFGTNEHGVCIFKGEQFISYSVIDGLANPQVWAITQDIKGRFWFGTNEGISIYDPTKKPGSQFVHYNQNNKNISNQVRIFQQDKKNNIWIATLDQGIMMYNIQNERFVFDQNINSIINSIASVTALAVDKDDDVWIGKTEGLQCYRPRTREIIGLSQSDGLMGNEITALFVDKKNVVWVGIKGKGINSIDGEKFISFPLEAGTTPNCIAEDKDGALWIGTLGQGVLYFKNGEVQKKYTEADGLLANLINLLYCTPDGEVFVGTNKGLNKINLKENKIFNYTRKNGFVGIETKTNAVFLDNNNRLWFGTVNGAMCYDPQKQQHIKLEPLTHISRLRVNLKDVNLKEGLELNYKENGLIIDYHSMCLVNPDAVRYQIMLEGADKDWQPVTEQRSATYSALPPGHYIFKVKARNSDGIWNAKPVSFSFTINPPFYKTWWFISLCIILGAIAIFAYITIRERNLIKEKRILEEKVRERTIEVTEKNEELAYKNKSITDSIRYAKRIQFAILPPEVPYNDTFILFKPKDIVSGDFYWIHRDEEHEFLAAVDCTGHGVPGAFMSIIGHILLNKIVKEYKIFEPAEILNQLNKELTDTLHTQTEAGTIADGMDLALICYQPSKKLLEYAGAYNSMYHIREGQLTEYPANRFSIGRNTGPDKRFTNNKVEVVKNDVIFLCSDGYEDQFGGPNGKKFKRKSLNELFLKISEHSADIQKDMLDKSFEDWRADIEQIDDVLVIGRRF